MLPPQAESATAVRSRANGRERGMKIKITRSAVPIVGATLWNGRRQRGGPAPGLEVHPALEELRGVDGSRIRGQAPQHLAHDRRIARPGYLDESREPRIGLVEVRGGKGHGTVVVANPRNAFKRGQRSRRYGVQRRLDRGGGPHDSGAGQPLDRGLSFGAQAGPHLVDGVGIGRGRTRGVLHRHIPDPGHRRQIGLQPVVARGEDDRYAHATPGESNDLGLGDALAIQKDFDPERVGVRGEPTAPGLGVHPHHRNRVEGALLHDVDVCLERLGATEHLGPGIETVEDDVRLGAPTAVPIHDPDHISPAIEQTGDDGVHITDQVLSTLWVLLGVPIRKRAGIRLTREPLHVVQDQNAELAVAVGCRVGQGPGLARWPAGNVLFRFDGTADEDSGGQECQVPACSERHAATLSV